MLENIDNLLFDLDGTLTDPKEGIVNSILYALTKLNIRENCIEELNSFIGPPLRESFAGRYNLTAEMADKAVRYYREYYSVKGLFENKIYPGVKEMLESLSSHNYHLFVATSKPTVYAVEVLRYFEIYSYFKETVGSNLDNTRSEKTEIISHLISEFRVFPGSSVMIGDRKHDIIGGKNNSLKTIAVTYGYGSREELSSHQPDFIVNNCKEIQTLFVKQNLLKI